jgi:hypothetical protein
MEYIRRLIMLRCGAFHAAPRQLRNRSRVIATVHWRCHINYAIEAVHLVRGDIHGRFACRLSSRSFFDLHRFFEHGPLDRHHRSRAVRAMSYTLSTLVDDLRATYREQAPSEALGLMVAAKQRGMLKERDVFTSAAIMLCGRATETRTTEMRPAD